MDVNESRDGATIRTLRQIDPDLAGLFEWGRELCNQPDRPGLVYLIAHVGRELTNSLIEQLEEDTVDKTELLEAELGSKEDQRYRMASALGLSPNHDVVRRWFEVHQIFRRAAHARVPAPAIGPLRPAFAELADLIYGRIGEYFQTQAEIDALADSIDPTAVDLSQLQRRLLRPVQRRRFFSRIQHREWLEPLTGAGFFRNPPGRQTFADGSWRARPWPEGDYLTRMAPMEPTRVLAVLFEIPDTHENPIVWFTIAKAIKALPDAEAAKLAPNLARAIRLPFSRIFAHDAVEAAASLAKRGQLEAFLLVEALLWPGSVPPVPLRGAEDNSEAYLKALSERQRELDWQDKWTLARVAEFEFDQLVDHVFPQLRDLDGLRLLDLLAGRTDKASKLASRAQRTFDDAIQRVEEENPPQVHLATSEPHEQGYDEIESRHWCKDLRHVGHSSSIRAHLAVETYKTARHLMEGGISLSEIIARLETRKNEVFTRMVYALIAEAPELDVALTSRLDAFVAGDDAIDPPFGATETAALLRAHFIHASSAAQKSFLDALQHGPGEDYIRRIVAFWERADTEQEHNDVVAEWQQKRLRWFHDKIPPILQPLAAKLGLTPTKPTNQQQSLDETGSWSSSVSSGGRRSPVTWQNLADMAPSEIVQYLTTWRPSESDLHPFDSPSFDGLEQEVSNLATNRPEIVATFLPGIVDLNVPLGYLTALLRGFRSALHREKKLDASVVMTLAKRVWARAEYIELNTKTERQAAEWAADSVSDLFEEYFAQVELDDKTRAEMWSTIAAFVQSPVVWRDEPDFVPPSTYSEARNASFSRPSARLTRALLALAWSEFMTDHARATWPPPKRSNAGDAAIPILEAIIRRDGSAAFAARGVFGERLPQLLWFAYDWMVAHLSTLLDLGSEQPGPHPAWSVYLGSAQFSAPVFKVLRPWYARHAAFLPSDASDPPQDPGSELAQDFALHVVSACVTGACSPGDSDALVETTFSRLPVDARTHAYWAVFRGWSDSKRVSRKSSRNVITFWESRLHVLEQSAPSDARDQEVEGLCWFIATPHLPLTDVIRLGTQTTRMLGSKYRVTNLAWEQLGKLAVQDAKGTFAIVEQLVDRVLKGDFPYLSFDDVAPSIRRAILAGGKTRDRALALIHRIGDAGFEEFGVLWQEAGKLPRQVDG